jgi:hypothetical protein
LNKSIKSRRALNCKIIIPGVVGARKRLLGPYRSLWALYEPLLAGPDGPLCAHWVLFAIHVPWRERDTYRYRCIPHSVARAGGQKAPHGEHFRSYFSPESAPALAGLARSGGPLGLIGPRNPSIGPRNPRKRGPYTPPRILFGPCRALRRTLGSAPQSPRGSFLGPCRAPRSWSENGQKSSARPYSKV